MKGVRNLYPLLKTIPAGETDTYLVRGGIGEERKRLCAPAHIPCTGCRVSETLGWAWSPVSGEKGVDTIHAPGGTQKHVYAGQPEGVILAPRRPSGSSGGLPSARLRVRSSWSEGVSRFATPSSATTFLQVRAWGLLIPVQSGTTFLRLPTGVFFITSRRF